MHKDINDSFYLLNYIVWVTWYPINVNGIKQVSLVDQVWSDTFDLCNSPDV